MLRMPKGSFRSIRDDSIESMKEALAAVEPIDVPKGIITFLIIPVWLWEGCKILAKFTFRMLIACLVLPVTSLYYLVDTFIIMTWFFWHIVLKMSERK